MSDTQAASLDSTGAGETALLRQLGPWLLIIGGFVFVISNVAHPRSPDIEVYQRQIETVAASDIWIADHLASLFAQLLITAGLVALGSTLLGRAAEWARLGGVMAVVSAGLGAVLWGLDGVTSKFVHDAYAAAQPAERATALRVSDMMENIDVGLFSVLIILLFGLTFLLYGAAVVASDRYPAWLGWVAAALASAAVVIGVVQAYNGLSVLVTNVLFASVASLLSLWVIVIGVLMLRRARPAQGASISGG